MNPDKDSFLFGSKYLRTHETFSINFWITDRVLSLLSGTEQ